MTSWHSSWLDNTAVDQRIWLLLAAAGLAMRGIEPPHRGCF